MQHRKTHFSLYQHELLLKPPMFSVAVRKLNSGASHLCAQPQIIPCAGFAVIAMNSFTIRFAELSAAPRKSGSRDACCMREQGQVRFPKPITEGDEKSREKKGDALNLLLHEHARSH